MPERISEAIGADHRSFDEYYEKIIAADGDEAAQTRWRNQLTWTVARHAISEELTMYPAMEKYLGDEGVRLSKTDKEQHAGVKKYLAQIQDMTPSDPQFRSLLDQLMVILHHHVEHERQEDMPRLEALLPQEESEALGASFQNTKMISPTQSHPSAPTSYVLESLAALMSAPIDRFKDLTKDFPTKEDTRGEYKLSGVQSLAELNMQEGEKREVGVEGISGGKILLVKTKDTMYATSPNCTHYGAPLVQGVVSPEDTLTCPWHGACFKLSTGDVEDAPALDPIATFGLFEKNGAVFIKSDDETIKSSRKRLNIKCSAQGSGKVVVIGGGSSSIGVIEELRKLGFKGKITVVSQEASRPFDRTKLSKALASDLDSLAWRSSEFYKDASIDITQDEVVKVDFNARSVSTKSGKALKYTKLVLASGGKPRSLPLQGLKEGELRNVFLIRSLQDTQQITASLDGQSQQNVVIIGGSFIGMEVANCIAGMNHSVTVIDKEPVPTALVFGEKVGGIFKSLLEKKGIKFITSADISHAGSSRSDHGAVGSVHLKDGTSLPADIVIQGVGVKPATDYLHESPGAPKLEKDGSIRVDEAFAVVGQSDVYALGDIATFPYQTQPVRIEHWNVAQNSGRQAARAMQGQPLRRLVPVFWSALGGQLRYCGNTSYSDGFDDVVIQGETEVKDDGNPPSFAAFYAKGEEVVAVASMMRDPVVSTCIELMRKGKMPSKSELKNGMDPRNMELRQL